MIECSRLSLQGMGVAKFLQQYTTHSWAQSLPSRQRYTAFLNREGRVVAFTKVALPTEQEAHILLPALQVDAFCQHLAPFLVFSKLKLQVVSSSEHVPLFEGNVPLPWIPEHTAIYTAFDLSLDVLGHVELKKGCYLGQEIVTRTHSRVNEHKKRLVLCSSSQVTEDLPLWRAEKQQLAVLPRTVFGTLELCRVFDTHPIRVSDT